MIVTLCKNCGFKKSFNEDKLGKMFKCPNCGKVDIIKDISQELNKTKTTRENLPQTSSIENNLNNLYVKPNQTNRKTFIFPILVITLLTFSIIATDFYFPLGFDINMFFIVPLILVYHYFAKNTLLIFVSVFSIIIVMLLFHSNTLIPFNYAILTRGIEILVFFILSFYLFYKRIKTNNI